MHVVIDSGDVIQIFAIMISQFALRVRKLLNQAGHNNGMVRRFPRFYVDKIEKQESDLEIDKRKLDFLLEDIVYRRDHSVENGLDGVSDLENPQRKSGAIKAALPQFHSVR